MSDRIIRYLVARNDFLVILLACLQRVTTPNEIYELMYQMALIVNGTLLDSQKSEHDSVSGSINVESERARSASPRESAVRRTLHYESPSARSVGYK